MHSSMVSGVAPARRNEFIVVKLNCNGARYLQNCIKSNKLSLDLILFKFVPSTNTNLRTHFGYKAQFY